MIESIGNFRTSLRSGYKAIYEVLNKLRVGNNNFQTIISEHLISDENSKPLDLVQSHDIAHYIAKNIRGKGLALTCHGQLCQTGYYLAPKY